MEVVVRDWPCHRNRLCSTFTLSQYYRERRMRAPWICCKFLSWRNKIVLKFEDTESDNLFTIVLNSAIYRSL